MTSNNFTKCKTLEQIAMPQIKTIDTTKQSELERIVTSDSGSKGVTNATIVYKEAQNEPTTRNTCQ